MATWLQGELAKLAAARARESDIRRNAPTLFSSVWSSVVEIVTEANANGFEIIPNGNSEERRVIYCMGPTRKMPPPHATHISPEEISIFLVKESGCLTVTGSVSFSFPIMPCPESIVCLHYEGEMRTAEQVAQIIMGKFLRFN